MSWDLPLAAVAPMLPFREMLHSIRLRGGADAAELRRLHYPAPLLASAAILQAAQR